MSFAIRRALTVVVVISAIAPAQVARARPCWEPPVDAAITDPFREPSCPWCPGNRGIEYGTRSGERVRAVATGRVSFAGNVAGTVYVVVRHGDGRRVTYANVASSSFSAGDLVVRGQTVGRTAGRFHLGVRVGERYVDPAPLLGSWVHRARLVPNDGGRGNAPSAPRLRCSQPRSD